MDTGSNAYARVYLDKRTPECQHELTAGCYHCCDTCNYDLHRCAMCGDQCPHETNVCASCAGE